jgi:SOS-response transcriptional repressor LexA
MNASKKNKPLSPEEKEAALRLRALWDQKKDALNLRQAEVAKLFGFKSQSAVSQYLNGGTALNLPTVLKFASLLKVSPLDIFPGIDPALLRPLGAIHLEQDDSGGQYLVQTLHSTELGSLHNELTPVPLQAEVPLISWVSAGLPCPVIDNHEPGDGEEMIPVPRKVSEHAFALRVSGDSMSPEFCDGAIIVVDPAKEPRNGSYVVVRIDDAEEATFKQLVIDAGTFYLKPLNARYPVITMGPNMFICGSVVCQITNYS